MSELVKICKEGLKKIKPGEGDISETIEVSPDILWENVKLMGVVPYLVPYDYFKRKETRAKVDKSALKEAEDRGFPYVAVECRSSEHVHGLSGQKAPLLIATFNFYINISSSGSK